MFHIQYTRRKNLVVYSPGCQHGLQAKNTTPKANQTEYLPLYNQQRSGLLFSNSLYMYLQFLSCNKTGPCGYKTNSATQNQKLNVGEKKSFFQRRHSS